MAGKGPETAAFCITCGGPEPIADGECEACIREELEVVKGPDAPVRVRRCAHCGAVPIRDSWSQPTSLLEMVEQTAIGAVEVPGKLEDASVGVAVRELDPHRYTVTVDVQGTYRNVDVQGDAAVEVKVDAVTCTACSRRHGGYYEAVVQVRHEGDGEVTDDQAGAIARIIEEAVTRAGGLSGTQGYLLKATSRHGGYDYYFGAKPVAKAVTRRVCERFGATSTSSSTLHGRQDGKDLYRLTLAVRIPRVRPGTIVGYEGEVLEIYARQGNRLLAQTIPEGEGRTIEDRHIDRLVVLEPRTADVVYAEAGEGQVLDPDSLKAVQVRMPADVSSGDQVRVVRYEDQWVVLSRA